MIPASDDETATPIRPGTLDQPVVAVVQGTRIAPPGLSQVEALPLGCPAATVLEHLDLLVRHLVNVHAGNYTGSYAGSYAEGESTYLCGNGFLDRFMRHRHRRGWGSPAAVALGLLTATYPDGEEKALNNFTGWRGIGGCTWDRAT